MKQLPRIFGIKTRDFFFTYPFMLKLWDLCLTFTALYMIPTAKESNPIMAALLRISPLLMSAVALGGSLIVGYAMYRAWDQATKRIPKAILWDDAGCWMDTRKYYSALPKSAMMPKGKDTKIFFDEKSFSNHLKESCSNYVHKRYVRTLYKLGVFLGYVVLIIPIVNNTIIVWRHLL